MADSAQSRFHDVHRAFLRAREDAALRHHHLAQLDRLAHERKAERVAHLGRERRDVERLEAQSLWRLLARASIGESFEERLSREQIEAEAAADAVELSNRALDQLTAEQDRLTSELDTLGDTDSAVAAAREHLVAIMHAEHPDAAARIVELDDQLGDMHAGLIELHEARSAGDNALRRLHDLEHSLHKAKTLSSVDMWLGGGILVSMIKRDRIRVSSERSRQAAAAMAAFDRELDDLEITRTSLALDDALSGEFFDVWFDNFWTDMRVHGNINTALRESAIARARVVEILGAVDRSHDATQEMIAACEVEREAILAQPRDAV